MISTDAFERISVAPVTPILVERSRLSKATERLCGLGLGFVLSAILMLLL